MKYEEFIAKLEEVELNRQEFASKTGMSQTSIYNWSSADRPVPAWVESWLENYKAKKDLDKVVEAVRPYVKPE